MQTTCPSCYCGKPYKIIKVKNQKQESHQVFYLKPQKCGHCGDIVKNVNLSTLKERDTKKQ